MSFLKRIKNLWTLSGWDLNQGDTLQIRKLTKEEKVMQSQFIEPVSFKQRFEASSNMDDLLDK